MKINQDKKLIIASASSHKISEMNSMVRQKELEFKIVGMRDMGIMDDIIEDGDSLEANALIKARYLFNILGEDVFAEDTGLEVNALQGAPGVHTARYAGPQRDNDDNIALLLQNLDGVADREAQFRTVIALIYKGKEYLFEGKVKGTISDKVIGNGGFGYDPIFIPEGYDKTFGVLDQEIKNRISHRRAALDRLLDFLEKNS